MENFTEIFIIDSHQDSREILKAYIQEFKQDSDIKLFSDYDYAISEIKKSEKLPLVFIDISENDKFINNKKRREQKDDFR